MMSIVLPPLPDPASTSPSPPAFRINKRMRPINKLSELKNQMKEAQVHLFDNNPLPPFPIPLSKLVLSKRLTNAQRYNLKRDGMTQITKIMRSAMSWGDKLYWRTSESMVIKHGFDIWLQRQRGVVGGKVSSTTAIRKRVEAFLICIGQKHDDLNYDQLNEGIIFCLTHFGHIYNRWQPNKDCDDPEEAAWRADHLIFDDYLQAPASVNIEPSPKCKRKREDEELVDESSQNERPAIRRRVTRRTSMSPLQENEPDAQQIGSTSLEKSSVVAIRKVSPTKKHVLKNKFKQAVIEIVRARPLTRSMTQNMK
ncbi:hypothetical protein GGU10DRAFT_436882 [Lentinula aff. detonsa]|uniref:Uncharacterized protein n=1 Tax=Lentinula aff. detonsa TaxID=2804958 RepID=A0AA38KMD3_9AGAR|nr:hypothetical protein GGU10DRAFT_436882 [Lentinula aff. detonsa]